MININQILEALFTVFGSFLLISLFHTIGLVGGQEMSKTKPIATSFIKQLLIGIAAVIIGALIVGINDRFFHYLLTPNGYISAAIIFLVPFILGIYQGYKD